MALQKPCVGLRMTRATLVRSWEFPIPVANEGRFLPIQTSPDIQWESSSGRINKNEHTTFGKDFPKHPGLIEEVRDQGGPPSNCPIPRLDRMTERGLLGPHPK